jgi:type III restriction enzyme
VKIRFKQQPFQLEAVRSVVDCFAGQPNEPFRFTLERKSNFEGSSKLGTVTTFPISAIF